MGGNRNYFAKYRPDHLGTQPVKSDANKGKKMNTKGEEHANYIPPHGDGK
ncbi:small acid-soluble spore protein N (minor) [Evansella caseinilytica]|uniref:Small acid-soluble spore protein N (Minor) n=1 Tax=Evansella caseinilytica TaxID=1503961 RepID=A0A1H3V0H1_9BACI|nr:acid-soluble spore protein N [Evansella caseinilytica]SDZ68180.1 small acid-soluble spore protein N (minor) [Evansella caseinilytica]